MAWDRRRTGTLLGRWTLGGLFIAAGIGHFAAPRFYVKIMPPYLPYHETLVFLSGAFEFGLGLALLFAKTARVAAWGLIGLLIAVFPANLYMAQNPELFHLPPVILWLRLPLQGLLILWVYAYTKTEPGDAGWHG